MIIIEKHYRERSTYIAGDYVANGCQLFHKSKLSEVCVRYDVSDKIRQEVLTELMKNKAAKDEENLESLAAHPDIKVRQLVAMHPPSKLLDGEGNPIAKHLDILVNDLECRVTVEVAKHGRGKDLDVLVSDRDREVRLEVAKHGRGKDLDVLFYDKFYAIRCAVAEHGRDRDLDVLVKDSDYDVRQEVARRGRAKDLNILASDRYESVRLEVIKHGRVRDAIRLFFSDNWEVRGRARRILSNKINSFFK